MRVAKTDSLLVLWVMFLLIMHQFEKSGGVAVLGILCVTMLAAGIYYPANKTIYQLLCATFLALASFYALAGFVSGTNGSLSQTALLFVATVFLVGAWLFIYLTTAWLLAGNVFQSLKALPMYLHQQEGSLRMSVFSELTRMPAIGLLLALAGSVGLLSARPSEPHLLNEQLAPLLLLMVIPFSLTLIELSTFDKGLTFRLLRERDWLRQRLKLRWLLLTLIVIASLLLLAEFVTRHRYVLWFCVCLYLLLITAILARLATIAQNTLPLDSSVTPAPMKPSLRKDSALLAATSVYTIVVALLV